MSTFFTADPHFGHANIIKYCNRPFANVDEMNEELVSRWNSKVTPSDTVFILGDLALGKLEESLEYVKALNGFKFLIPGNHDKCWSGHKKPVTKPYEDAGLWITSSGIVKHPFLINGREYNFQMCHFPYEGDSHEKQRPDRYADFRPKNNGRWLIHGHVHDSWKINEKQLNVGVDVWDFYPVSKEEIEKTIAEAS